MTGTFKKVIETITYVGKYYISQKKKINKSVKNIYQICILVGRFQVLSGLREKLILKLYPDYILYQFC